MDIIESTNAMGVWSQGHCGSLRIGLVPTMGYLHAGHASLMAKLRPHVDRLVVSIYVNALQFGVNEDFDRYPRDLPADLALCRVMGVDAVFAPECLYPSDFSTTVGVRELTDVLCGLSRPTHFDGVSTVVARLFGLTRCHVAAFGEKDWQQLAVIRRMVRDLAMPVEIVGGRIVREPDGLALSSRNVYLSARDRRRALTLSMALHGMQQQVAAGEYASNVLIGRAIASIDADRIEYLSVVDAQTLRPMEDVQGGKSRVLVAAHYGQTRLIDNVGLG